MPGKCSACYGRGEILYRYGKPGQYRVPYLEIEWEDEGEWKPCPACLATGWAKAPRKQRPERGAVMLHAPERALQRALDELKESHGSNE